MHFTKAQREVLNNLSLQLFGVSSRWQKMMSKAEFQKVTEEVEDAAATKYVALNNSPKQRGGTVMRLETAKALGKFRTEKDLERLQVIENTPVKKVKAQQPTFQEIHDSLVDNLDIQKLSALDEDELLRVCAYRVATDKMNFAIELETKEGERGAFEEVVAAFPEDVTTRVKKYVPAEASNPNAIPLDGFTFAKEVSYILGQPELALVEYVKCMSKPLKSKAAPRALTSMRISQVIEKTNRARNKKAKAKK